MNTSNIVTGQLNEKLLSKEIERTNDILSKPAQPMEKIPDSLELQLYKQSLKNLPDEVRQKVLREIVEDYL